MHGNFQHPPKKNSQENQHENTNHPISSNSHPSATANMAIHCLKRGVGQLQKTKTKTKLVMVIDIGLVNQICDTQHISIPFYWLLLIGFEHYCNSTHQTCARDTGILPVCPWLYCVPRTSVQACLLFVYTIWNSKRKHSDISSKNIHLHYIFKPEFLNIFRFSKDKKRLTNRKAHQNPVNPQNSKHKWLKTTKLRQKCIAPWRFGIRYAGYSLT